MPYTALTDAEIAAGRFWKQETTQKLKDNFDYLYAQSGLTQVLGIPNGSFEVDSDSDGTPDNWTAGVYSGGTRSLESSGGIDGARCMKFVHPGGAGNGGGWCQSDYIPMSALVGQTLSFAYYSTAAGLKVIIEMACYDSAHALLGTLTLYTSTANPTQWTLLAFSQLLVASVSTRYVKFKFLCGYTDTDVAGSVYLDDVRIGLAAPAPQRIALSESISYSNTVQSDTSWTTKTTVAITIPSWAKWLCSGIRMTTTNQGNKCHGRISIGASNGSDMNAAGAAGNFIGESVLDVSALAGARTLSLDAYIERIDGSYSIYWTAATEQKCYRHRMLAINFTSGAATEQ